MYLDAIYVSGCLNSSTVSRFPGGKPMMYSLPTRTGNGQNAPAPAPVPAPAPAPAPARPLWLPPGVTFESLPKSVQQAVLDILNPVYQELVLKASDPLERGQGLSYCNLLFLELLTTCGLVEWATDVGLPSLPSSQGLAGLVGVTGQKGKVANFLFEFRKFRHKVERESAAPPPAQ
jgi:hypothetical protein